jgi:very-short-patch-repair endonuclease
MSPTAAELLAELGGVARYAALATVVGRDEVEAAVGCGAVVRDGRGIYALPDVDAGLRVALRLGGVLSLTSAAMRHGWAVKTVPDRPHVTVGRGRKLGSRARLAHVHWADLDEADVAEGATVPSLTLAQCLRALPGDEALVVADSALREDGCHQLLARIADEARGPGSRQVRDVAARASALAANPFESVSRSLCDEVPGLRVEPQVGVGHGARPDLVDRRLRIVVECDSFEWHGSRSALAADARRYNRMVVDGWIVLRLTYEDVMFRPDEVRQVLAEAVALAELLVQRGAGPFRAA